MASYTVDAPPRPGALVTIHRPNKKGHGQTGRFVEAGEDPLFGWVALHTDKRKVPSLYEYEKQATCPRKLFPLSNLVPYEPEPR